MTKAIVFAFMAVLTVANARNFRTIQSNDITPVEKEGRALLEIPLIGMVVLKVLKTVWIAVSSISTIINFKLAILALVVYVATWAFSSSFPLLVGAVITVGFCKITGVCTLSNISDVIPDASSKLEYAGSLLDMAALKYETRR